MKRLMPSNANISCTDNALNNGFLSISTVTNVIEPFRHNKSMVKK